MLDSTDRRVFWSDEELASVVDWLKANGYTGHLVTADSIQQAQKAVLPPERHRRFTSPSMMKPAFREALEIPSDTRGKWTREECGLVAAKLIELGADPKQVRTFKRHVRTAQTVLPVHRQHSLHKIPQALYDAFTVAKRAHTRTLNAAAVAATRIVETPASLDVATPEAVPPVVAESQEPETPTAPAPVAAPVSAPISASVAGMLPTALGYLERFLTALERGAGALDTMAKIEAERFARVTALDAQSAQRIAAVMEEPKPPVLGQDTFIVSQGVPPPPPTPRKKHVLVVGGVPGNIDPVLREFPDWSIRHIHGDKKKTQIDTAADKADVIVLLTKFAGHGYHVRQLDPFKKKVLKVNGSGTDVVRSLRLWDAERRATYAN